MMHSYNPVKTVIIVLCRFVLILVVMDDALVLHSRTSSLVIFYVLILVVMDDALVQK